MAVYEELRAASYPPAEATLFLRNISNESYVAEYEEVRAASYPLTEATFFLKNISNESYVAV